MCTSDAGIKRKTAAGLQKIYLLCTVFCALFGAVYESFSFGVWSFYMVYAFACPLILGALPSAFIASARMARIPRRAARGLWHAGVAALTVGCIFKGVLDIYGTSSPLTAVYFVCGGALLAAGAVAAAFTGRS